MLRCRHRHADVAGDVGCDAREDGDSAGGEVQGSMCGEAGASSEETDCAESALSEDGAVPSQCLVVLECCVLLCTGLAVGQGHRTEVGPRAVGVCAALEGAPHARFHPVDLLVPGFIKSLGSRNLICPGGRGSRLGFGLRRPGTAARPWWRRRGRIRRCCTRVRDMRRTGTRLQSGWDILPTESHFVEAVGQWDQGVHGLPDGPVSGENLLEGWASKRAVRRDGEGKRQKLVVESFDHEQVHFV